MNKTLLLSILLLIFLNTGCQKEKTSAASTCILLSGDDYLIFGTYAGFCSGNCSQLYKLTSSDLFEDDNSYFVKDQPVNFKSQPLNSAKLALAEELCKAFPYDKLLLEPETLGCPDCHDQGVVYFELKKNGALKKWYVDPDQIQDKVPDYLKSYVQSVRLTVDKLK